MKRAFTLIELLVVIAIIAILVAILFPVLAQAKFAAKKSAQMQNAKQISASSLLYAIDVDDNLPIFDDGPVANLQPPVGTAPTKTWATITAPYLKSVPVLVDPERGDVHSHFGAPACSAETIACLDSPAYLEQNANPYFGLNYIFLAPIVCDDDACDLNHSESKTTTQIPSPSNIVFYVPSKFWDVTDAATGAARVEAPGTASLQFVPPPPQCDKQEMASCPPAPSDVSIETHSPGAAIFAEATGIYYDKNGGTNVTFLDSHAKYMKWKALTAGTDWGRPGSTLPNHITDPEKYLWDGH